jgi:hypothetical protein
MQNWQHFEAFSPTSSELKYGIVGSKPSSKPTYKHNQPSILQLHKIQSPKKYPYIESKTN